MSLLDNLCNMLKVKFPSRITADEEVMIIIFFPILFTPNTDGV